MRIDPAKHYANSKEQAMNRLSAIAFGAVVAVATTAAYGQEPSATVLSTTPAARAPYYYPDNVELSSRQSATPLFTIGGFAGQIWAPVKPPYNTEADRNLAADPMWDAG
ncbi:MAG TPA: hypothetical protein VFE41_07220 [Acetobacteraceae bacterium]|nr:hypothetical protein [Acetobacteraceae bacterium]